MADAVGPIRSTPVMNLSALDHQATNHENQGLSAAGSNEATSDDADEPAGDETNETASRDTDHLGTGTEEGFVVPRVPDDAITPSDPASCAAGARAMEENLVAISTDSTIEEKLIHLAQAMHGIQAAGHTRELRVHRSMVKHVIKTIHHVLVKAVKESDYLKPTTDRKMTLLMTIATCVGKHQFELEWRDEDPDPFEYRFEMDMFEAMDSLREYNAALIQDLSTTYSSTVDVSLCKDMAWRNMWSQCMIIELPGEEELEMEE